jgi:hypothetical protein
MVMISLFTGTKLRKIYEISKTIDMFFWKLFLDDNGPSPKSYCGNQDNGNDEKCECCYDIERRSLIAIAR